MLRNAVKYPDFISASTLFCQLNKKMTQNMQRELGYLKHNVM